MSPEHPPSCPLFFTPLDIHILKVCALLCIYISSRSVVIFFVSYFVFEIYSKRGRKVKSLKVQITGVLPTTKSSFTIKYRELARLGLGNKYPFVMHLKYNSVQMRLNQLNYVSGIRRGTRSKTDLPLHWTAQELKLNQLNYASGIRRGVTGKTDLPLHWSTQQLKQYIHRLYPAYDIRCIFVTVS